MQALYKNILYLIILVCLVGCGERQFLAPVSESNWRSRFSYPSTHIVKRGETLYAIAFKYETDYKHLAAFNHLYPPYKLRVGQVLRVQKGSRISRSYPAARRSFKTQQQIQPSRPRPIYSPQNLFASKNGWFWPVRGQVVSTYLPTQGKKGINIASKKGERVRAASSGVVAYAGSGLNGYGNLIIVKHNNEYLTAYGNNARNLVKEGQYVKAGQEIAEVGIVDHRYFGVHFEIRRKGIPVNPLSFLQKG